MWYKHPVICLLVASAFILISFLIMVSISSVIMFTDFKPLVSSEIYETFSTIISVYLGYYLYVKLYEKRSIFELSLYSQNTKPLFKYFNPKNALTEITFGLFTGTLLITFSVVILVILGLYKISFSNISISTENLIWILVTVGLGAAFLEELIFRGIIFRLLEQWLGSWLAIIFSGLLFGFVHLGNPNSTIFSSLAIAIEAGILLAAIYMITRKLWMVIGLHFSWNVMQGLVYSIPVSGIPMDGLIEVQVASNKSNLLTGGAFGVEASLITMIIMSAISIYLLKKISSEGQIVQNKLLYKLLSKNKD